MSSNAPDSIESETQTILTAVGERSGQHKRLLVCASIVSIAVVLLQATVWSIDARYGMPISALFYLSCWSAWIFVLVWSGAYLALVDGSHVAGLIATLLLLGALAIVWLVPFTNIWLEVNFRFYRSAREEVVRKVGSGELVPNAQNRPDAIMLGPEEPLLSAGGNWIIVEKHEETTYILFLTFRGILGTYSGFLHVSDGGDPSGYSDFSEYTRFGMKSMGDGWYFVSFT
jgi:hypothetical protein